MAELFAEAKKQKNTPIMNDILIWIIAVFGLVTLIGVFCRMHGGFGPFNLRAVGIVMVGTFAALLGSRDGTSLTAAMGILGAIAGYLFGIKDPNSQ
jgi:hypothetical protein